MASKRRPNDIPVRGQNLRIGQCIAKVIEVFESPNDLLISSDFNHLRVVRASVAIAEDDVSVR